VTLDEAFLGRVTVVPVKAEPVAESIEATGRIIPAEEKTFRVGAAVEGRIERTDVEVGDRVKESQTLAGMHSHDIHDARADYRRSVSEKRRSEESLQIAIRQRDRARRLLELRAGSQEQLDTAEAEVVRAEAAVRAALVEEARVHEHITEVLQVAVEEGQGVDLIPVKTPAAGVVLKRDVTTGTVVTAGQELFVISDLTKVLMLAQVPEMYLGRLRVGQAVIVTVQSYPGREFSGRIERLGEELDPETRTLQVRIALANKNGELKPESYAAARIPLGGAKPVVMIPSEALQQLNGASVVFVRTKSGAFEARPVEPGRSLEARVEVVQGLDAGELVAVRGAFLLKSQLMREKMAEE
jgi:cobalt-zinc-cadmium efflux system membrane fusion protein